MLLPVYACGHVRVYMPLWEGHADRHDAAASAGERCGGAERPQHSRHASTRPCTCIHRSCMGKERGSSSSSSLHVYKDVDIDVFYRCMRAYTSLNTCMYGSVKRPVCSLSSSPRGT